MISYASSPLLELAPYGTTLTAITSGRDDRWLRAYAIIVRELNADVLLSFAPESNGWWYSLGMAEREAARRGRGVAARRLHIPAGRRDQGQVGVDR